MRQAVFHEARDIRVEERPSPTPGPHDVLLRVDACGVCGSDVASFLHGHYAVAGQVLGHEMACTVVEAGSEVPLVVGTKVAVCPARSCGDCAYCEADRPGLCSASGDLTLGYGLPGGFSDLVLYPQPKLGRDIYPVPDGIPVEDLLWCEPLAVAVRTVRRALAIIPTPVRHLAVLGAGSVGLCVVAAARALGVPHIAVVEPREQRREAAASLAMETSADFAGLSFAPEVAIDSSGATAALEAVPPHIPMVLVGLGDGPVPWPRSVVATSFAYSSNDFSTAVEMVVSGSASLGHLVTHRKGLDDVAGAIEASAHDPSAVKVAIFPSS